MCCSAVESKAQLELVQIWDTHTARWFFNTENLLRNERGGSWQPPLACGHCRKRKSLAAGFRKGTNYLCSRDCRVSQAWLMKLPKSFTNLPI